jgi:hypothetical protein
VLPAPARAVPRRQAGQGIVGAGLARGALREPLHRSDGRALDTGAAAAGKGVAVPGGQRADVLGLTGRGASWTAGRTRQRACGAGS